MEGAVTASNEPRGTSSGSSFFSTKAILQFKSVEVISDEKPYFRKERRANSKQACI